MEPSTTTSTSPTSHERDFKGNKGDDATMIPLVDMMTCDCLEDFDAIGMSYDSFTFPCDTCDDMLQNKVKHVVFHPCIDIAIPCYENFEIPPMVPCNMMNNCSFPCVACNAENDDAMA